MILSFLKRHRKAEERIGGIVALEAAKTVAKRAGIFGAGVAMAAVIGPNMVDLSNNNGAGAARAIAAPGVQAVEAKATEGLGFRDGDYPVFRAEAARRHRPFGGYLFLHPDLSGAAQADFFLAYAKPRPGDLEPVVDSETGSPSSAARATYAALAELQRHGFRPILYASSYYVGVLVATDRRIAAFPVWDAEYGPTLHTVAGVRYVAWQFTDRANVGGFSLDGSHLLVRSVTSLEIPKPRPPKPLRCSSFVGTEWPHRPLVAYRRRHAYHCHR